MPSGQSSLSAIVSFGYAELPLKRSSPTLICRALGVEESQFRPVQVNRKLPGRIGVNHHRGRANLANRFSEDAVDPLLRHPFGAFGPLGPGEGAMRDAFLKNCLVEGAVEARSRGRSARRKTLVAALLFEATIVFCLVLWPLLSAGSPPPKFVVLEHSLYPSQPTQRAARDTDSRPAIRVPNYSSTRIVAEVVHPVHDDGVPVLGPPNIAAPFGDSVFTGSFGDGIAPAAPRKPEAPVVRVIRRSEGVQESQLISRAIPVYPQIARVARIAGTVELMVLVGRDGSVLSVQVLSGSPLLATAAKEAVEKWRYRPAILDGHAVEVESRVTVNFVLDE